MKGKNQIKMLQIKQIIKVKFFGYAWPEVINIKTRRISFLAVIKRAFQPIVLNLVLANANKLSLESLLEKGVKIMMFTVKQAFNHKRIF